LLIKSLGHPKNLGLGEAAIRNGITALDSDDGWMSIPVSIGGKVRNIIIQWGTWRSGTTADNYKCNITFPIPFPVKCACVTTSTGVSTPDYEFSSAYRSLRQQVSIGSPGRTGADAHFFIESGDVGHSRCFSWLAIGF
jgi:hypothetical protein